MATDPVLLGRPTDAELSDQLLSTAYRPMSRAWWFLFWIAMIGTISLVVGVTATVTTGIGLWGNNIPVAWGFGIINFVWWIGIGHAGTFISAILLLLEQKWRTSINRFAEGMTLFAVVQAGLFPILHLGRPWFAYWVIPYPSTMQVWPQFKSALPWDAAAIATYFTVSLLFWYTGLVPDLAAMRDRAPGRVRRIIYGVFALGWSGSAHSYRHYRVVYGLLAGLSTPLVVSVHSIVSSDFAITMVPGWHSTIFPPFFVAGAIFSGFAMVLTLMIPARSIFGLENVITLRHLDNIAKMLLVTSWILTYSYALEFFVTWYSGDEYDIHQFFEARPFGPWAWLFWTMLVCNVLVPQLFWFERARKSLTVLFFASFLVNLGMWAERFVIIVMGLQRDYLPSAWHVFIPTGVDWAIFLGTMGFFLLLFLLFLRFVPFVPVAEVKELAHELKHEEGH
ncbi:NrfD/PsrC family molybdoenzyme membrane anchor subunit [Polyangium aurulentum]|uniref:NrfD/PsrC family molybdoenzyme membrane anchor subunit n=1 Tax=Polyangium aurulentum TaxID=2567896 RepID=UPI0010ADAB76|nr:NrfD/PsrC family molybdoenzyme membrane anchor subunit [Polyangium aurulentum]UQA54571.1 polysulfide reductase NrfD [Polyangium aurulentum]